MEDFDQLRQEGGQFCLCRQEMPERLEEGGAGRCSSGRGGPEREVGRTREDLGQSQATLRWTVNKT